MNERRALLVAAFACGLIASLSAARVVPGNTTGSTSFTFSIGSHARSRSGSMLFIGALQQNTAKEYALSLWGSDKTGFFPWAPQVATINGVQGQVNPLYDASIAQLGLLARKDILGNMLMLPVAVAQGQPRRLCFVQEIYTLVSGETTTSYADMLVSQDLVDATGAVTSRIVGVEGYENEAIFAAVTPSGSAVFGQPGSGVAVVQLQKIKIDDCLQPVLTQINAQPGSTIETPLASALDVASAVVKIGNDAVSIANAIDMYYSETLKRLYIALQVEGAGAGTDGARAIVVGRLIDGKLTFAPIAPDAALALQTGIVGGTGANTQVSLHKVRVMRTTTGLDYLIVVGNVGDPSSTQNQVYALPLVNTNLDTAGYDPLIQGTLANVTASPINFYTPATQNVCSTLPSVFTGRAFTDPAVQPDQIWTDTSVQAVVGITALPAGNITDINVSNDVVFVSVADPATNQNPGIFYAQALFDETGAIAAWTPWQRVAGTIDPVYGFTYKSMYGNFGWLTGQTDLTVNTVKESIWGAGDPNQLGNLVTVLSALFPQPAGGIQGFFDLPLNSPGLFDISVFIATGLKKVALIQSGSTVSGTYSPTFGNFSSGSVEFTDGTVTQTFPVGNSLVAAISGGVLDDIGPIVASTVGVNVTTQNGYLFVGGACGLAVLTQPDGAGWDTTSTLSTNLAGLVAGMQFVSLGNYCFVRKLIYDEGFLYVLTDTKLDRIAIASSNFASGTLSVTTIATIDDIDCSENGTLLDVVVSASFAVLASSSGLYRAGNYANVRTAIDAAAVNWTEVTIPEGEPVVQQLQPIASNNVPNGLAKTANGNLYILDAYAGLDIAQENRYTVQGVVSQPINSATIAPLPDMRIKDILTSFDTFANYKNLIYFDGTDNLSAQNRHLTTNQLLRDELYTLNPILNNRGVTIPLGIEDASIFSALTRSSASGAWLVTGDFGLRVNE